MAKSYWSQLTKRERARLSGLNASMREAFARKIVMRRKARIAKITKAKAAVARLSAAMNRELAKAKGEPEEKEPTDPFLAKPEETSEEYASEECPPEGCEDESMGFDDLSPLEMESHGLTETLYQRTSAPKLFTAGSKIRVFRYNSDTYVEVSTPVMLTIRGGRKNGAIQLLTKLDPLVAKRVPPDHELSGAELGATTGRMAEWWAGVKPKLQSAFVKAIRSPVTALLTGISLFVSGWGLVYASAYVGARAALAIAGPPKVDKATLPGAVPAKVAGVELGAMGPASKRWIVVRVGTRTGRDTYAAKTLKEALDLAMPDPGDWVATGVVYANDAGAARLKNPRKWRTLPV